MFKHFKDNLQYESERETTELESVRISTRNVNAASLNVEEAAVGSNVENATYTKLSKIVDVLASLHLASGSLTPETCVLRNP